LVTFHTKNERKNRRERKVFASFALPFAFFAVKNKLKNQQTFVLKKQIRLMVEQLLQLAVRLLGISYLQVESILPQRMPENH